MGSSSCALTKEIMQLVHKVNPTTVLDVGCGTGKWGFLIRETLELRHQRPKNMIIDAVEVDKSWLNDLHNCVYDHIFNQDIQEFKPEFNYDLIIMSDILEHFNKEEGLIVLNKLLKKCGFLLVHSPFGRVSTILEQSESRKKFVKEFPYEQHKSEWNFDDFLYKNIVDIHAVYPNFCVLLRGE